MERGKNSELRPERGSGSLDSMARSTYTLRPQARLDALEIARYIARDNPRAADAFLIALEETCRGIVAMPLAGTRRSFVHPLLRDVRMTPVRFG